MKKILFLITIGLLVGFSSCTTIGTLSYDRLQSADVSFPDGVRKVGIVNNMPPSSLELESNESKDLLSGDGKIMADAFAQAVAETDYFDQVVVCDSALYVEELSGTMNNRLSTEQVDSLIQTLGVDLLFSLDQVYIQLKENSFFVPGLVTPIPVIDGIITPVIKTYVAGRSTPLFTISKSDSIYWEVTPSLTLGQVVKEASEFAATVPMKHLLPYWEEVNRTFFNGGNVEMRDAGVYIQENNWDAASLLWKKIYEQKKGKAKMQAAYNLALYHEMQDDFEKALEYLEEALLLAKDESAEKRLMEVYQLQLKAQSEKSRKLKMQMSRFDNIF